MSVSSIQSSINNVQREVEAAQRKVSDKSREEADKIARIASIQRSITKSTSASTLQSKARETERLQNDIARIQRERADASKRVAEKTERLHKLQSELFKEQHRQQERSLKKLEVANERRSRQQEEQLAKLLRPREFAAYGTQVKAPALAVHHDVFISHASEDKADVVEPLAEGLKTAGFDVWYDRFQLTIGDSLRQSIDLGLANSRFGIVILSPAFFAKNWTQYELNGLVQREIEGGKVILPLWHKVSKAEVIAQSPSLADKLALSTSQSTIDEIVKEITAVLRS